MFGLKQSPRCWNSTLDAYLKKLGFLQLVSDPCLYSAAMGQMIVVCVFVDDIVVVCKSEARLKEFKQALCKKFDMKDLEQLCYILGMKVIQDEVSGDVWICQSSYGFRVLERFGMQDAKSVVTPVDTSAKIVKAVENDVMFDRCVYQCAVGSLLYSTGTRPAIAFAVGNVARFSAKPTTRHWTGVKRIFHYLKGTPDLGLLYSRSCEEDQLVEYSDSDWAGDLDDRKSVSGHLFKLCGAPIS